MARVDFYVLNSHGDKSRQVFACRLAEKAYRCRNTVHIQVTDTVSARQLDELLWTFRDGSFLPHTLIDSGAADTEAPVSVGVTLPDGRVPDLLINLTDNIPERIDSFPRIAEIVTSDDDSKARSRTRFAGYRDAGHTLDTHKL